MTYSSISDKRCPDCGRLLPRTEFGQNRLNKDGLQVYCRSCCARRGAEAYRRKRERMGKSVRPRVEVPPGHKRCPGCGEVKPLSEWHRNSATRSGYADRCKPCRKTQHRRGHLKRKFGLSESELADLIAAQGGVCAVCRDGEPGHIDHDHETGSVRGVLCGPCNMGLGQFRDDPDRLMDAAAYLEKHGRKATRLRRPIIVESYPYRGILVELADYRHSA